MDFWVWIIIMVVVAIAKGWGKLAEQIDQNKEDAPPAIPRPPPKRVSQPRPARSSQPPVRPRSVGVPPVMPSPVREAAPSGPRAQRTRFERAVPHPLVARAIPPVQPKPVPAPTAPPATPPAPVTTPRAPVPEPVRARRASQWAEAMRDKQNVRNVVIAMEILGPPKGA